MSNPKSMSSLGSFFKKVPIARRRLRKYSWLPDVLRIEGSIIPKILGPVLTVTAFAVVVATVSEVYGRKLNLSNNVLPLLSVVVGLILVFRNSTSYDRYYEARKEFAIMTSTVRNLSRLVWVQVNLPVPGGRDGRGAGSSRFRPNAEKTDQLDDEESKISRERLTAEKIRAVKLLLSFIYAVVHHLRNEPGIDHPDYEGVLPPDLKRRDLELGRGESPDLLSRYATYAAIDRGRLGSHHLVRKVATFHKGESLTGHDDIEPTPTTPLLGDDHTTVLIKPPRSVEASSSLPLIIAHELARVIFRFKHKGYIDILGPAGYNTMNASVAIMIDGLTALERIATTPIPISYGIHLKQCVSLYLFTLPFTLIHEMHWRMVPLVTVVAFTLIGIEGIADRLEMPFKKGSTDLPLDGYCVALRSEIEYMIERLRQGPEEDTDLLD